MRKTGKIIFTVIAALLLVLAAACTPREADLVEGILQNVDAATGELTIVTKDGKTITVTIGSDASVETEDTTSGIETLVPGVSMEVEVNEDGQVVRLIKVKQEEVEGDEEAETSKPGPVAGVNWGIVKILVTDPPPADVKSAVIHLSNIEVHRVSGNTSGWITVIGAPSSFDLMDVIGVTEVLGSANITAGSFTQIRMDVTEVTGNTTDDVPYTAEVPGDKLKIVRPFNVGAGATTILTLDFDGEKSLIRTGNDRFLFKPVVKLLIEKGKAEQEREQEQEQEQEQKQKQEQEQGQETEELEFEGTIDAIDGNIWTMTIDGETRTVDVSEAEIEGEPAIGLPADIKGIVVDDTIMASEVEIKEDL
ncbi:DUF4382 domain-containing protein [Chloroflexota bacterium]